MHGIGCQWTAPLLGHILPCACTLALRCRFHDTEAEAAAAAAALGPVQQSQGADLAELLSRAEPFERGYYYRYTLPTVKEGLDASSRASGCCTERQQCLHRTMARLLPASPADPAAWLAAGRG